MTTFSLAGGRWEFDTKTGAVTIDGQQVGTVRPMHSQVLAIMGGKVIATTHTVGQAQDAIVEHWRAAA